jgi:hypothetical protein
MKIKNRTNIRIKVLTNTKSDKPKWAIQLRKYFYWKTVFVVESNRYLDALYAMVDFMKTLNIDYTDKMENYTKYPLKDITTKN